MTISPTTEATKGELTKAAILERAMALSSKTGLEGLTIGRLATELEMSKSGIFAHFKSKQALQIEILLAASHEFVRQVVDPGLAAPKGEPRLRELFARWLAWGKVRAQLPGGCIFVQAAAEFDDRPGVVRDRLVRLQSAWLNTLADCARDALKEGHIRTKNADAFAHHMYGIALAYHHQLHLMRDSRAEPFARQAFDALMRDAKRPD